MTVREGWRGLFFEGTEVGGVYEHPLRRTATTTGSASFTSLGSHAVGVPGAHIPRGAIEGDSHLYAPNHSLRLRPATRHGVSVDSSNSPIGFRCVVRGA
jgi:hypothetical protein